LANKSVALFDTMVVFNTSVWLVVALVAVAGGVSTPVGISPDTSRRRGSWAGNVNLVEASGVDRGGAGVEGAHVEGGAAAAMSSTWRRRRRYRRSRRCGRSSNSSSCYSRPNQQRTSPRPT